VNLEAKTEPTSQRGMPSLESQHFVVILVLSSMLSMFVIATTSSFFPVLGSMIVTLFVVTMCVLISRMPQDEHHSRTILLAITFVVAVTPYVSAYSFIRVSINVVNGTGSKLGNVIVSYPRYTEETWAMCQGVKPGEAISVDACLLYGSQEIRVQWNDENQKGMEGSRTASYAGDLRDKRARNLILLGESRLVSNRDGLED